MKIFFLWSLGSLSANSQGDRYKTLSIHPRDESQLKFLSSLESELEGKVNFWTYPSTTTQRSTDIMVPPQFLDEFKGLLESVGLEFSIMINDVQALIDETTPSRSIDAAADFDYSVYHTYDEIQQWTADIAAQYSSLVERFQIAESSEGRQINALRIRTGGFGTKKAVYWQGGLHAREWITPATVMYITNKLLENYGTDSDATEILNTFDFVIVPLANPDGYVYTMTDDRMWRKTRSVNSGSACRGVDPNRNYPYQWGGQGASTSKCASTYRGPNQASEPEVAETTQWLLDSNQEYVSFIDFHSYSQLWLAPWSYSASAILPQEKDDHDAASAKAVNALKSVYGTTYTYGPSARTLYAASGCSVDWGFRSLGAKYSYVVELRDDGTYGFLLPENQILPTGVETYEAVKALCQHMVEEYN
ncbi:carboxypeptidase B-like [Diadema antillarum]|uniref:carboxypeptidase B-like n=1 Tax=Diadema antillarum TaxID=105358 RepID=UPI003A8BFB1C